MSLQRSEAKWWPIHAAGVAVLLAALVAAWALGVRPREQLARRERERLASAVAAERRLGELENARDLLSARLEETERDLAESGVRLYGPDQRLERVGSIAAVAEAVGLRIVVFEPGAPVRGPRHDTLPLRLTAQASGEALRRFLGRLADEFPDVRVERVAATAQRNAGDELGVEASLSWHMAQTSESGPVSAVGG